MGGRGHCLWQIGTDVLYSIRLIQAASDRETVRQATVLTIMVSAISPETRRLIEAVVNDYLDGHRIEVGKLLTEFDEYENEYITINLRYAFSPKPVDPKISGKMLSAISDRLIASGDLRIPYVIHDFDDKQVIKDSQAIKDSALAQ